MSETSGAVRSVLSSCVQYRLCSPTMNCAISARLLVSIGGQGSDMRDDKQEQQRIVQQPVVYTRQQSCTRLPPFLI